MANQFLLNRANPAARKTHVVARWRRPGKVKTSVLELKSPFPEKLEKSSPFKSSESRRSFVHEFLRAERPLKDMRSPETSPSHDAMIFLRRTQQSDLCNRLKNGGLAPLRWHVSHFLPRSWTSRQGTSTRDSTTYTPTRLASDRQGYLGPMRRTWPVAT